MPATAQAKDRCALLVIDMQVVAFDGKVTAPISSGATLLSKVAELIACARAASLPIVFLQTCAVSGQPYAKDVHGWEIHPSVAPVTGDKIVYKVQSNGFEDTDLDEVLTKIKAKSLITCGIWSEYCVTATSSAALELGFTVCVAADGHGTVAETTDAASRVITKQNEYLAGKGASVESVAELRLELI